MKTVKVIFADPREPLVIECDAWINTGDTYTFTRVVDGVGEQVARFTNCVIGCYEMPSALAERAAATTQQLKKIVEACVSGATPVSSIPPIGTPWMFGESIVVPLAAFDWRGVTEYTAYTPLGRYIIKQDHSGTDFRIEFCERGGYTHRFKVVHKSRDKAYAYCRDDYRERVVRLVHKDGFKKQEPPVGVANPDGSVTQFDTTK